MNKLPANKRKQVIALLVEGTSIKSIVRLTGVAKTTILRLLPDISAACLKIHDERVRGLNLSRLECDEAWSFCGMKQKNVPTEKRGEFGYGDTWTWSSICPDTKLLVAFRVGLRTGIDAYEFMNDLAGRVTNIDTLSTDAFPAYPQAIRDTFGDYANYIQIHKVYKDTKGEPGRYSPGTCIACEKKWISGFPDITKASTSLVERFNLSIRTSVKRFARLTLSHSKKIENHVAAVSLFAWHYNFARKHLSLGGKTPAQAAGLSDRIMTIDDLIGLLP